MRFDTLHYFVFFAVVYVLWRLSPRGAFVLLIASTIFYVAENGNRDIAVFSGVILFNYVISFVVKKRFWLLIGILFNVIVLAFFKYRQFLLGDTWLGDFTTTGLFHNVAIPLGISFYIFQAIAYLVDVKRGHAPTVSSPHRFALFLGFFPQLIAGPIMRGAQLIPQLAGQWRGRGPKRRLVIWGLVLICAGIIKKVVLADSLAPFVDDIFHNGPANALSAWIGAGLFAFQIYFDFSGYSDMAVGMAYLVGIRLLLNFRQPYLSRSPREFWQRWHITLSTWIRDYLYIPLGGNRGSAPRQICVLIGVMGIAGLWHGANWTFIIWGIGWGTVIALWRWTPLRHLSGRLGWLITMLISTTLWVPFRAPNLDAAKSYLGTMVGFTSNGAVVYGFVSLFGLAALLGLHRLEAMAKGREFILFLRRINQPLWYGMLVGIIGWLLVMPKFVNAPFIYFRF